VASGTGGPRLGGGRRPRRITTEQRRRVVTTVEKRPTSLGQPFTRWSARKPARIEWLLEHEWDLTFVFDEFGPLAIMPMGGSCRAEKSRPQRLRATYHKPYGTRQLFARYSIGADRLHDRIEPRKGATPTLRALKAIRAHVPDGKPIHIIHVILYNLNHHRGAELRQWCEDNAVELAFTPRSARSYDGCLTRSLDQRVRNPATA